MRASLSTHFRFFITAGLCSLALGAVQAQELKGGTTTAGAPMSSSLVPVTQAMLDAAAGDGVNHLHPNSNYEQTRYYPAAQIGTGNVDKLKAVFTFQTAVLESMETAPWPRTRTCSTWARSTPSSWRSTPRQAKSPGRSRSQIRRRATPRPWRRPWWRARC